MKIKFVPENKECEVQPGESILQVANRNQVFIKSICKGVPSCAECRVRIVDGESSLIPPFKAELNLIGTGYFVDHRRLACQARCFGDVVVDLTDHVDKVDSQNTKKIRGLKLSKEELSEIKAVHGTMVLDEKNSDEKS